MPGARRDRSLRVRVRDAIAVVTALALLLFGLPLAIVVERLLGSQALAGLQRDATRGLALVPDNAVEAGSGVAAPPSRGGTSIGVYDTRGTLIAGRGPSHSALAVRAASGGEHSGQESGDLAVAVPIPSDTAVAGSLRAAEPLSQLRARVLRAWALLAVLALAVIAVALALARRAARRISQPFEQLTAATRALGDGTYDPRLPRWGIPEADAAGDALQDSARDIDLLLQHERAFVRDASHQLRTPLSGMVLHLEQEPPDVMAALGQARRLETTISDLVALRGLGARGTCDPAQVAGDAVRRWTSPARPVSLRADDTGEIGLSEPALRQSLDVLLDNALRHGAGAVTVTVEPYGDAVVVEVADEGPGFPDAAGPGTGLQLASRIVVRAGGALLIRRRAPSARVALLLPVADEPAQSTSNR